MASERPIQLPCGWCNNTVQQPEKGRLLRYCNKTCRQRAYEVRAVGRRLQEDLEAGLVQRAPAQKVVKVPRPAYPNTVSGWEQMLGKLTEQLRDGRFPLDRDRIREALLGALALAPGPYATAAAPRPDPTLPRQRTGPGAPLGAAAALATYLRSVYAKRLTLAELAAELGVSVPVAQHALAEAVHAGTARAMREGQVVNIATLPADVRFKLTANCPAPPPPPRTDQSRHT